MKRQKHPTINFFLQGGLGNQLFIYFAGNYYSRMKNKELQFSRVDHRAIQKLHPGSDISESGLPNLNIVDKKVNGKVSLFQKIHSSLYHRFVWYKTMNYRLKNTYHSQGIGFDDQLENIEAKDVHGYFQTWRYFHAFRESFKIFFDPEIVLETKLANYISEARVKNPIVVHVRRGDYLDKKNEYIGVLSSRYYKKAFLELSPEISNNPIWVFSDDIALAEGLFLEIGVEVEYWFGPEHSPWQTLLLMSLGSAHIISNSSFAWWGAAISESTREVIFPGSWFRRADTPKDLTFPNWKAIESEWE